MPVERDRAMNGNVHSDDSSIEEIASKLKGKTLKVYWYLLKNPKNAGLRDIQRGANLSSPSLASYHLDKLKELGLVSANKHGTFNLESDVKVGILRFFIGSGRLLVPRYLFYAMFYSALIPCFLIFIPLTLGPVSILLLFVLCFGAVTAWLETIRAWRIEI